MLAQGLKVLGDVSVAGNSRDDEFERLKEGRDRFLEEVNAFKMEKKKLLNTLKEEEAALKAMT